ncbi:MAG TPA: bacillithiol biosynthesis cysteine-adding enzyme BshC [Chitinophagaceae bacterium]|nr:bacillithiol biosynthesis cysteine-adding enzyme BshC [Chitinophagaceae bacterium]
MEFIATRLPYRQTAAFSRLVLDYVDNSSALRSFISQPPTLSGLRAKIESRRERTVNRELLVATLKSGYSGLPVSKQVSENIQMLSSPNCFTVTTAHQSNIFTGPLFCAYKILHTVRLAAHLNECFPDSRFVPFFYMGSEDADLQELNHVYVDGDRFEWVTNQKGAVGRMQIDAGFADMADRLAGRIGVFPGGAEIVNTIRKCYRTGNTIQQATLEFLNELFGEYGLLVLLPDNAELKKLMQPVFADELLHRASAAIVEKTAQQLESLHYRAQVHPREINLFYLKDGIRERIEKGNDRWKVVNTEIEFSEQELMTELHDHPERFSPNVVLRGLYQEAILPNVAFVGGGSELCYWLQLKDLFDHYNISFPVLLLRNSFQVLEREWAGRFTKLGFSPEEVFLPEEELMKRLVNRHNVKPVQLNGGLSETEKLYESLKKQAAEVDVTLERHVDALKVQTLHRLQELEKKMLRAGKRKFSDQQRQLQKIREHFFPGGNLQERTRSLVHYYGQWGADFIREIYRHSPALEQEFVLLREK